MFTKDKPKCARTHAPCLLTQYTQYAYIYNMLMLCSRSWCAAAPDMCEPSNIGRAKLSSWNTKRARLVAYAHVHVAVVFTHINVRHTFDFPLRCGTGFYIFSVCCVRVFCSSSAVCALALDAALLLLSPPLRRKRLATQTMDNILFNTRTRAPVSCSGTHGREETVSKRASARATTKQNAFANDYICSVCACVCLCVCVCWPV